VSNQVWASAHTTKEPTKQITMDSVTPQLIVYAPKRAWLAPNLKEQAMALAEDRAADGRTVTMVGPEKTDEEIVELVEVLHADPDLDVTFMAVSTDQASFHIDPVCACLHLIDYRNELRSKFPSFAREIFVQDRGGGKLVDVRNSLTFGVRYVTDVSEPLQTRLGSLLANLYVECDAPEGMQKEALEFQKFNDAINVEVARDRQYEKMYEHDVWQTYLRRARNHVLQGATTQMLPPQNPDETMFAISIDDFVKMGKLLSFEETEEIRVPLHEITLTNEERLWFVSHKWYSFGKPDRGDNALFHALVEQVQGQKGWIWIDFSCIHQTDEVKRVEQLAEVPKILGIGALNFCVYCFDFQEEKYISSAWCALEYTRYAAESYDLIADYVVLTEVELRSLGQGREVAKSLINIVLTPEKFNHSFDFRRREDELFLQKTLTEIFDDFHEIHEKITRITAKPARISLRYEGPKDKSSCCLIC